MPFLEVLYALFMVILKIFCLECWGEESDIQGCCDVQKKIQDTDKAASKSAQSFT